jgi:hypothetical protein
MKSNLIGKELKEKFFWPLLLGIIIFSVTTTFSVISDKKNKQLQLREKKLSLIGDFAESFETYNYFSGFRGMMQLEQMDYVKYFSEIEGEKIQIVELSIRERVRLADTMRKLYPLPYDKMMEGDLKASSLFKNVHLVQLLFSDSIANTLNNLLEYVPVDNKISEYIAKRMKTDSSKLTEIEKNKILETINAEKRIIYNKVLNNMVEETK